MAGLPVLSVVVAARNEARAIVACLDALLSQDIEPGTLEILVADDASIDETAALAVRCGVRCLHLARSGPAQARNYGVLASRGEIVAFVDADAVVAKDWAARLLEAFETIADPRLAGVGGAQAGHPDASPFAKDLDRFLQAIGIVADYNKPHTATTRVGHNASCNSAYRREAFLRVGGFRPGLFPAEDVDLDRRLHDMGRTVWFTPQVRIVHQRPANVRAWLRVLASYARGQADCVAMHGCFRPLHAVPFMWLVGLAALAIFPTTVCLAGTTVLLTVGLSFQRHHGLSLGRGFFFSVTTGLVYPVVFLARLAARILGRPGPAGKTLLPLSDA